MASVVIPWRGGDPQRELVRDFLKPRLSKWRTLWGESTGSEWCKAEAVMEGLKSASSDVVAVIDADVWTDGLESAFRAVTVGAAEWAVPHKTVYRLTQEATARYMNGEDVRGPTERRPYEGVRGGGCVVAHRDTLLEVPLDPRFRGIDAGHEDEAWGAALQTLCGSCWRGNADLVHLWHPPRPRLSHRKGSHESWEMFKHYLEADRNPEHMAILVKEARESFSPNEPPVPDRSPVVLG